MKRHYLFLMRSYVAGALYLRGDKAELDSDKMKGLVKMGAVQELPEPVTPVVPTAPVAPVTPIATTTPSIAPVTPVTTVTPAVPTEPVTPAEPVATVESMTTTELAQTDTPSSDVPSNDSNVYGNLTKAQLNAELDKRGIAHDAKATNAELEALLVADDEKKATATAPVETATATPNA